MLECPTSCPFVAARTDALAFPVGQVRRLASPQAGPEVDETRRNVLKLLAIAGVVGLGVGGAVGGALQYVQPPPIGLSSYPRTQLLDVNGQALTLAKIEAGEYTVNSAAVFTFNYPLINEPNFLLNIAGNAQGIKNVPGGIGTDGTIVAYSAICQHLGCPAPAICYYPPNTCAGQTFPTPEGTIDFFIHCSCHGSTYDVANAANNLTGPAVLPLPQVILETDASGNLFATGMTPSSPPVNGHVDTLKGSYGVGSSSQLIKQSPVILCSFPS